MAKKRKEAYLNPKTVLTQKEYSEYKGSKQILERFRRLKEMEERKRQLKRLSKQVRQERSYSGKVGRGIARGFAFLSSPSRAIYAQAQPVIAEKKTIAGRQLGKVGRPKGSYKQIYAQYGGVYGYRKALALENFKRRQEILQSQAITPRQQMILQQIRANEQAQRENPEGRVFPDTNGHVNMRKFQEDIDTFANIAG